METKLERSSAGPSENEFSDRESGLQPEVRGVNPDFFINPKVVECAKLNAKQNKVKIRIFKSNLFSKVKGKYNKIIFNPPYLPSDKTDKYYDISWSGGKSGVEVTNKFLSQVTGYLRETGEVHFVASSLADLSKIKVKYKILKRKKIGKETISIFKTTFAPALGCPSNLRCFLMWF